MIFSWISYTMNKRFFDSETPGPLYEVGQTLKAEGNELYSFIDASCSIYKQDITIIVIFFLAFPINNLLAMVSIIYGILTLIQWFRKLSLSLEIQPELKWFESAEAEKALGLESDAEKLLLLRNSVSIMIWFNWAIVIWIAGAYAFMFLAFILLAISIPFIGKERAFEISKGVAFFTNAHLGRE